MKNEDNLTVVMEMETPKLTVILQCMILNNGPMSYGMAYA